MDKEKKVQVKQSRKVAYSAVGAALSLVMITLTAYLPVTVAPLVVCALAWNVVLDKCGIGYGLTCIAVSVGLGFLTAIGAGFVIMIIVGIVFIPYSLLAFALSRITYDTAKGTVIRLAAMTAFGALAMLLLYLFAEAIVDYININAIINNLTNGNIAVGYLLLTVIMAAIVIAVDIIYLQMRKYIIPRLK